MALCTRCGREIGCGTGMPTGTTVCSECYANIAFIAVAKAPTKRNLADQVADLERMVRRHEKMIKQLDEERAVFQACLRTLTDTLKAVARR